MSFTVEPLISSALYTKHLGVKRGAIHDGSDPGPGSGSWMTQSVVQEVCPCTETQGPCSL